MSRRDDNLIVNEKLRETRAMLGTGVESMGNITEAMHRTSAKFNQTTASYDDYGSSLSYSGRLVREIRRRVKYQDMIFYVCFYFYLAVCAYIFLKRFPLSWLWDNSYFLLGKATEGVVSAVNGVVGSVESSEDL
mmetsp:Transcript_16035/g.29384  ORF Transcript_16035/g.29384 Transcript_16035/m.29384 type:complete len:134 (+) Transcript_16035:1852-2253(+)